MRWFVVFALFPLSALAEGPALVVTPPGPVTQAEGLAAWERLHAVISSPRCVSCHVGADNIPRWDVTAPHGMNIDAGDSRIGAETLACSTCHTVSRLPNTVANAAPHVGVDWALAPVEFVWLGIGEAEICAQLRDPARNGGRDGAGLVEHIVHDAETQAFIAWSFDPGPGRAVPPGSLQDHLDDMSLWTAAGMPCPAQ